MPGLIAGSRGLQTSLNSSWGLETGLIKITIVRKFPLLTAAPAFDSITAILRLTLVLSPAASVGEMLPELLQFQRIEVGYSPVVQSTAAPMDEVVSAPLRSGRAHVTATAGQNEQVNRVFVPIVDQRERGAVIEVFETATNERKSVGCEIRHLRGKIDFAVKPRLHGVLV